MDFEPSQLTPSATRTKYILVSCILAVLDAASEYLQGRVS